jgi:Erv1 / Alr family
LGKRIQELASSGTNSSDSVKIDVHAVSCAPNRPLCRALAIDQYPYFRIFLPGDNQGFDVPHAQVNPITILQKMGIEVDETAVSSQTAQYEESFWESLLQWGRSPWKLFYFGATSSPKGKFDVYKSRANLRDDIHLSFDYIMRQAVFLSDDPLPLVRAEVLFAWLRLLRKTLPVSWTKLHAAVQNLIDNFDYVKRSESYMITILEEYAPPSKIWSMSCSHGEVDAGFSCGLWELFHTVTVGVVDYNRAAAFHRNRLATEDVARTIRSVVDTFFPCEICRRNFVAMFDSCDFSRCKILHLEKSEHEIDWIQLPLWLLETHNGVNVRLMKEKAEREKRLSRITVDDEIAVTWPPVRDCPRCWQSDGAANPAMIYKYLKLAYGQRDDFFSEYKQELLGNHVEEETGRDLAPFSYDNHFAKSISQIVSLIMALVNCVFAAQPVSTNLTLENRRSDLFLFLVTSLHDEIFPVESNQEITDGKKALLKDWFELLRKTLPVSWYEFHSLIQELLDNFAYVSKNRDYLLAVLDDFPPRSKEWSSNVCIIGGKAEFGYICALFEMYQVIAMGLVHYNKFVASDNTRLATANVAHILRSYIIQFLNSSHLRRDIIESITQMCSRGSCEELLETSGTERNWVYLPLWISRLRDSLSRELSNTSNTTVPGSVAKTKSVHRWPSSRQCPICWIDNENWDADHVYQYLLRAYGQESISATGIDSELHSSFNSKYESPLQDLIFWIGSRLPKRINAYFSEIWIEEMSVANDEL